jgi:hypothetical protein
VLIAVTPSAPPSLAAVAMLKKTHTVKIGKTKRTEHQGASKENMDDTVK